MWKGLSLLAANEVGAAVKRNVTALLYYAVAALIALVGIVFVLMGLHGWLSQQMSSVAASFVLAAALLVLAVIVASVGAYVKKRREQRAIMAKAAALMAAPLAAKVSTNKTGLTTLVIGGVVLAGVLLGRQLGRD